MIRARSGRTGAVPVHVAFGYSLPGPRAGALRLTGVKRRDQILEAAGELFARNGYEAVGVDDIGAAIGITGPAIYYYFAGKEEILAALLLPRIERLLLRAGELVEEGSDPLAILRSLVAFHVDFVVSHPTLSQVHDRELHNLSRALQHEVRLQMSEYVAVWSGILRLAEPAVDPHEARAAVQAVFGLVNSTPVLRWRRSRAELAEFLCVLALSALAGILPRVRAALPTS